MIKRIQLVFDIVMLILVLSAEGSRFFNFFILLSGSEISAFIFAIAVSLIIVYLALSEFERTSKFSVIVCIGLSIISYIDPFVKEIVEVDSNRVSEIEKKFLPAPVWKSSWDLKDDKELKKKTFNAEFGKVAAHNKRVDAEILLTETVGNTKKLAFLFSAFLMSFCVPLLTYLISHKLAKHFGGIIEVKRNKETVQDIYAKLGGSKI